MNRIQLFWFFIIAAAIVTIGALMHGNSKNDMPSAPTPSEIPTQTQMTVVNGCVLLCQTIFEVSSNDANSPKENACKDTCYTSAGLPSPNASSTQK